MAYSSNGLVVRHRFSGVLPSLDGLCYALLDGRQSFVSKIKPAHEIEEIASRPGEKLQSLQPLLKLSHQVQHSRPSRRLPWNGGTNT